MTFDKRVFYALTAFVMTCGLFCMILYCNEQISFAEELRYEFDQTDQTLYIYGAGSIRPNSDITKWAQTAQRIVIGEGITAIEDETFSAEKTDNFRQVREFVFPSTLETIGKKALYGCTSLTEIVIPDSVDNIGVSAFGECNSLEKITVPFVGASRNEKEDSLSACFGYVFASDDLIGEFNEKRYLNAYLSAKNISCITVTGGRIYDNAFQSCEAKRIELTEDVTSVGNEAFSLCSNLTDIAIYGTVEFTGEKAFYASDALESVHIASIEQWCSIVFDEKALDPSYSKTAGNNPMCVCKHIFINGEEISDIVITSDVSPYSFYACSCINSVTAKGNVGKIGEKAFARCNNIKEVYLSSDIGLSVGDSAFDLCKNISSVKIEGNVKSIESYAFQSCRAVANVELSSTSGLNVGAFAFSDCQNITTVILGNGVKRISEQSFSAAHKLSRITVSPDVEYFGKAAFVGANDYYNATLEITDLGKWCNTFFNDNMANPMTFCNRLLLNGKEIKSLVLDESTPLLRACCLTGGCFDVVCFKKGVNDIADNALYELTVKNIYFYSDIGKNCLGNVNVTGTVFSAIKNDYTELIGRNRCKWALLPELYGNISTSVTFTIDLEGNKLVIGGTGAIGEAGLKQALSDNEYVSLTNALVIESGITEIGEKAFSEMLFIKTVTIPETVRHIGIDAFAGCNGLSGVYAESVDAWLKISFDNTFANPLSYAGELFVGGTLAEKVSFASDINAYAFYNCTSLKEVRTEETVTTVGDMAFYGCKNIMTADISGSELTLGKSTFENCRGLEKLTLGKGVKKISDNCFFADNALSEIVIISGTAKYFGSMVFGGEKENVTLEISDISGWCGGTFFNEVASNPMSFCSNVLLNGKELDRIVLDDTVEQINDYCLTGECFQDVYFKIDLNKFADNSLYGLTTENVYFYTEVYDDCLDKLKVTGTVFSPTRNDHIRLVEKNGCEWSLLPGLSGNIGTVTYTVDLEEKQLLISGSGAINGEKLNAVLAVNEYAASTNALIIENGITDVGEKAFAGCYFIRTVSIPKTVTHIGKDAFDCISLTRVYAESFDAWLNISFDNAFANPLYYAHELYADGRLAEDVTVASDINDHAFYGCTSLKNINIGKNVKAIGSKAFYGCTSLEEIIVPDNVRYIGVSAFGECKGLERITVPFVGASRNEKEESLSACFGYVFASEGDLDHITEKGMLNFTAVPGSLVSVTVIGGRIYDSAFKNCKVSRIELAESVSSVGNEAFSECRNLTDIAIYGNVVFTGRKAFTNCNKLENIHITSIEQWCGISFNEYLYFEDLRETGVNNSENNPMSFCKHLYVNGEEISDLVITSDVPDFSFYLCEGITSVTIKGNAGRIGDHAFTGCKNMRIADISGAELTVGKNAFEGCENLEKLTVGKGVTTLSESCFSGDESLSKIKIGSDTVHFGKKAFSGSGKKAELEISDVEKWCSASFDDIYSNPMMISKTVLLNGSGLDTLTIGKNIKKISPYSLSGCILKNLYCKEGAEGLWSRTLEGLTTENVYIYSDIYLDCLGYVNVTGTVFSVSEEAVSNLTERNNCKWALLPELYGRIDTVSYTIDVPTGILVISGSGTINGEKLKAALADNEFIGSTNALVIESGITEVGNDAFSGNIFIKTVTIPETVRRIGKDAFKGCNSLSGVYAESIVGWQEINFDNAFANPLCSAGTLYAGENPVESVSFSAEINAYSFYNCTSLREVSIGENVKKIGKDAFYGCTNIENVFTENADTWYSTVFEDVYSNPVMYSHKLSDITGVIESITVTGPVLPYAFYNCSGLKNVTFEFPTECGYDAFFGCINIISVFSGSLTEWLSMDFASEYSNPLSYAKKLVIAGSEVEEITVPDEIRSIKPYAFYNFAGLTNVWFNDGLNTIGKSAFENCTGIKTLSFGKELKKIAGSAFGKCYRVEKITLSSEIESIDPYAFYECTNLREINFDSGKELFCRRAARDGNDPLFAAKFNGAGDGLVFGSYGNGECFVSDRGTFSEDVLRIPIKSPSGDVVVAIGKSAFENCEDITEVVMNDNIRTVEKFAFSGCKRLNKIKCSKTLNCIEKYAFAGCISVKEVILPEMLTQIDEGAFLGCEKLERFVVPESVTDIGYGAFANCLALEDITLPFIGTDRESRLHFSYVLGAREPTDAFMLPKLRCVRITDDASIPQKAFYKCEQLETVYATASDKTQSIGMSAFEGCTGLSKLVLSQSINSIGSKAFSNCASLKTLDLPEYVERYGQNVFEGCDEAIITEQYKKIEKERDNVRSLAEAAAAPIAIMLFFLIPFGKKNFTGSEK